MKKTTSAISILLALLMLFSVASYAAGGLTVTATANGKALQNAQLRPGDTIKLVFSAAVTDASVWSANSGRIKVKNASGTVVSATLATVDKKTVTVKLGSSLANGSYTLELGSNLTASNGATLGSKVTYNFTVKKTTASTPLNLVSVKVGDKDLEGGSFTGDVAITITFSREVNKYQTQNFKYIGVYNADGEKMEGVTMTDFTKDADGNSFTVLTLSGAPAGEYTLKIDKNVKANTGTTLGKNVAISFTITAPEKSDYGAFLSMMWNYLITLINMIKELLDVI